LTGRSIPRDSGSVTNVLVVTTTVRVVNRVHSNTTSLGPAVPLDSVLVMSGTSLEHRLVNSSTSSNDTNNSTAIGLDHLFGSRGELDTGLVLFGVVADNGSIVTRDTGKGSTVTDAGLNVANDGTFGHLTDGENVSNVEGSLLSSVDELTSEKTLSSDKSLLAVLVLVRVTEDNLGKRSTTTRVVDNRLDDTTNVTVAFGIVQSTELGGSLTTLYVGLEDTSSTLTLSTNNTTHF